MNLPRVLLRSVVVALCLQSVASASELVLIHGHIYTAVPGHEWADALSVTGTHIDAVGKERDVLKRRTRRTRVIDLQGRTVIPGIVDSHVHMWLGALALHGLNLSTPQASIGPDNREVLLTRLREYAAQHPGDKILFARTDFSAAEPYAPRHELLDEAVPDRPLIVHNTSEHALWLNSKALELAGITDKPLADANEERNVFRDANGRPGGVVIEAATEVVERAVRAHLSIDDQLKWIGEESLFLNRFGITSVVNATGDLDEIKLYARLRDAGGLTVRTRTAFGAVAVPHKLTPKFLADLEEARTSYHDDWVSANLVKFFADGSTGLIPPLVYRPDEFGSLVLDLDERGFQLMTHAQRADSVNMILNAYEAAIQANGPRDRRLRIEHDLVVHDADIRRYSQLHVIAAMQPTFCCTEAGTNYDPKEETVSDQWQSYLKDHVTLAFGSDWPCNWPPDPFVSVQEAVTREVWHSDDTARVLGQSMDGASQGGSRPTGKVYAADQAISVSQAIDAYTRESAFAAFMDDHVGSLAVGKDADLAVLSQDVFSVPSERVGKTQVLMTLVGGRTVYDRDAASGESAQ